MFAPRLKEDPEYVRVLLVKQHLSLYLLTGSVLLILLSDSSASRTPPLISTVEARVPVSSRFIDPAVTVIAPESVLPDAMETGVILATERLVTRRVCYQHQLPNYCLTVVLTLSSVIEFSRSLLLALLRYKPPL